MLANKERIPFIMFFGQLVTRENGGELQRNVYQVTTNAI